MTSVPEQLGYPVVVLLIEKDTGRRFEAIAISAAEEPDLDREPGACCALDRRPRYKVDGVEDPTFDPTIPEDLRATGWYWHGGWLTQLPMVPTGCRISVGMPRESLDDVWSSARKLDAAQAQLAEAAAHPKKKPARQRPEPNVTRQKPDPKPAPPDRQPARPAQLALW